MPRRRQAAKTRRGELGGDAEQELVIGPGRESWFPSDEARRAAFFAHRDQVMSVGPAGSRPYAWWRYESGLKGWPTEPYPSGAEEAVWLRENGYLTVWEERELEARRRIGEEAPATVIDRNPGGDAS
jgi:hypothetical protein